MTFFREILLILGNIKHVNNTPPPQITGGPLAPSKHFEGHRAPILRFFPNLFLFFITKNRNFLSIFRALGRNLIYQFTRDLIYESRLPKLQKTPQKRYRISQKHVLGGFFYVRNRLREFSNPENVSYLFIRIVPFKSIPFFPSGMTFKSCEPPFY